MMADAGFDGDDPLFKLVQRKFYLRTIAKLAARPGRCVDGWSREQGDAADDPRCVPAGTRGHGQMGARAQLSSAAADPLRRRAGTVRHAQGGAGKLGDSSTSRPTDQVLSCGARRRCRFVRELMLDEPIR